MRQLFILLVVANLCRRSVQSVGVQDDLFAFPQYEVVFSNEYITEDEANLKLKHGDQALSNTAASGSPPPASIGASDLSLHSSETADIKSSSSGETVSKIYERMILKNRTYLCSIPQARQLKNETEEKRSAEEEELELARAVTRGWELLEGMKENCIYYQSGWWSYSFCYESEIKQFHPLAPQRGGQPAYPPVEDPRVPSFRLGNFKPNEKSIKQVDGKGKSDVSSSDSKSLAIRKKGDSRYMVQQLAGGSICDLTGKPRKVEVQFHCHPQSTDRIGWIKETATCSYLMVIYTPRLCNDVAFLPPKDYKAASIECSEIIASAAELSEWHARQAARMEAVLLGSNAAVPARPVVGGIEVGGMKLSGPDGQRIMPPQSVEQIPNQGDVIAQWDPKKNNGVIQMVSDEELRSLKLEPQIVKKLKDDVHRTAAGRPWKLELVDVGDGELELIGVLDTGDEEDDQSNEHYGDDPKKQDEPRKQDGPKKQDEPKKQDKPKKQDNSKKQDESKKQDAQDRGKGSQERFKDEL